MVVVSFQCARVVHVLLAGTVALIIVHTGGTLPAISAQAGMINNHPMHIHGESVSR